MAEEKAIAPPAKKKGGMKKIIMLVAGVAVLGGAFFGGTMMSKGTPAEAAEQSVEDEVAADAKGEHGEPAKKKDESHGEAKGGHGEPAAGGHGEAGEGSETSSAADLIFDFGKDFTVNLLDPAGRQYVRAMIQVKAVSAEAKAEIEANVAPLRDATISLLSNKTREELATPAGKDRLKRELMARFDGILAPGSVEDIYLTDLVLMRQ